MTQVQTTQPRAGEQPVRYTLAFDQLGQRDTEIAGGKGANLGELTRAGFSVPPGFVLTAKAYLEAMENANLRARLAEVAATIEPDDPEKLRSVSDELRRAVREAELPPRIRSALLSAYRALGKDVLVAVRSSATAEDTAGTSFAGMNETYTNVRGEEQLIEKVRACWASLWGQRVISYRAAQNLRLEPAIAVVVQRMVNSECSGVMFTADPSTSDRSRVVIEAAFGLGEVVVSGQVEPDTYVLAKQGPSVLESRIGLKSHKLVRGPEGDLRVDLS